MVSDPGVATQTDNYRSSSKDNLHFVEDNLDYVSNYLDTRVSKDKQEENPPREVGSRVRVRAKQAKII